MLYYIYIYGVPSLSQSAPAATTWGAWGGSALQRHVRDGHATVTRRSRGRYLRPAAGSTHVTQSAHKAQFRCTSSHAPLEEAVKRPVAGRGWTWSREGWSREGVVSYTRRPFGGGGHANGLCPAAGSGNMRVTWASRGAARQVVGVYKPLAGKVRLL